MLFRFSRLACVVRLVFPLWCGMGVLSAAPAFAEDAQVLSQARAKFQQALELKQAGNWAAALSLLREVGQVRMTPQVRYHIAVCEEELGKLVAALGGYELALEDSEGIHPDFVAEIEASVESLRQRIPKLVIARGSGAAAATIELDGVALGSSSIGTEVPVDPGPHTLSARAPGYQDFLETVSLEERESRTLTITLTPIPRSVVEPEPQKVPPPVEESRFGVLPYVMGGVGVAGLAASGVFFVLHNQSVGSLGERCPDRDCTGLPPAEREDARREHRAARTQEIVMWSTFGIGAAALGTGIAMYLLDQDSTEKAIALPYGLEVRMAAPSTDAGLSLTGAF